MHPPIPAETPTKANHGPYVYFVSRVSTKTRDKLVRRSYWINKKISFFAFGDSYGLKTHVVSLEGLYFDKDDPLSVAELRVALKDYFSKHL